MEELLDMQISTALVYAVSEANARARGEAGA